MSSKHLATGSKCPPLENGKLRIYSMRFCPYAQRALLVAAAKNIPHDVVNCNLKQKPEFLLEKNPQGKVPTTEDSDGILYESLIVCDYMDEKYPGRKLHSLTPFQKAVDRIWIETFNQTISLFYKSVALEGDIDKEEEAKQALVALAKSLTLFDKELKRRATVFFAGNDAPGMLDYMIWPWIERLPLIEVMYKGSVPFRAVKPEIPHLDKWNQCMREDDAVKSSLLSTQIHLEYRKSFKSGTPNYDILEEGQGDGISQNRICGVV